MEMASAFMSRPRAMRSQDRSYQAASQTSSHGRLKPGAAHPTASFTVLTARARTPLLAGFAANFCILLRERVDALTRRPGGLLDDDEFREDGDDEHRPLRLPPKFRTGLRVDAVLRHDDRRP
jgi:hypothetical protein